MTPPRHLAPGAAREHPAGGAAGDLRGPKRMVLAVLAFFAASVAAVHYLDPLDAANVPAPPEPPGAVRPAAPPGADRAPPRSPDVAATAAAAGLAPAADRPANPDRARTVEECVERAVRAAGEERIEPTAPGRWPAVKRARERLRQRRLTARADCEREVAL